MATRAEWQDSRASQKKCRKEKDTRIEIVKNAVVSSASLFACHFLTTSPGQTERNEKKNKMSRRRRGARRIYCTQMQSEQWKRQQKEREKDRESRQGQECKKNEDSRCKEWNQFQKRTASTKGLSQRERGRGLLARTMHSGTSRIEQHLGTTEPSTTLARCTRTKSGGGKQVRSSSVGETYKKK